MKTQLIDIKKVIPYARNPRKNEEAVDKVMSSIKEFGFRQPIVVDTKMVVIVGHTRLMAAKRLGIKKVPVHIAKELSESQIKAYRIMDNRSHEDSGWNEELLSLELEDLNKRNYPLELTGLDEYELEELLRESDEVIPGLVDPDEVPEPRKDPIVKKGDIWLLGDHKLICGDAREKENILRLMDRGKDKAHLIYCDPPYNIGLDYNKGFGKQNKYSKDNETEDHKSDNDYANFLDKTIKNAIAFTNKNTHIFYWCDEKYIWLLQTLFKQNGIINRRVNLWVKNNINPTPQVAFNKAYEPYVYGTIGNPWISRGFRDLNEIMNDDISSKDIIENLLSIINIWLKERDNVLEYEHPTQKPVSLHYKPLKRCSRVGDVVLDLFGGSGSTLIACEQMSRIARISELDPVFCDVILRRWSNFTGKKAKLLKDRIKKKS